ncbi:hypothetical protein MMC72_004871 [Salmonella enterica]|nr:hypothetical protein [Salmonella enterica]
MYQQEQRYSCHILIFSWLQVYGLTSDFCLPADKPLKDDAGNVIRIMPGQFCAGKRRVMPLSRVVRQFLFRLIPEQPLVADGSVRGPPVPANCQQTVSGISDLREPAARIGPRPSLCHPCLKVGVFLCGQHVFFPPCTDRARFLRWGQKHHDGFIQSLPAEPDRMPFLAAFLPFSFTIFPAFPFVIKVPAAMVVRHIIPPLRRRSTQ